MSNHTTTAGAPTALVCHWVTVTDPTGRTHMEARWGLPQVAVQASHAA